VSKLNPKKIEHLTTPGTYEDGNGLRLVVKTNGSKSWVLRFQLNKKRREMGLGRFPSVSLKKARADAATQRGLLLEKVDPLAERERVKLAKSKVEREEKVREFTFSKAAADYIASHRAGWKNVKHAQQWANTLKTYAEPFIGDLPPDDITTDHVLSVLQPIWFDKPETASRVRNRMELVLDAAKARGLRQGENPARWRGHLDKLLPPRLRVRARKHHTALPYTDLPDFMPLLEQSNEYSYQAARVTILSALRSSEVLGAKWDEIDLKAKVWTIPVDRMKAAKEHRVPLSPALIDLFKKLPRVNGNPHVFPGMREGKHLSNTAMLMTLRRIGRGDLTMHGFRSTFRDWAGECTPHPRDVCEQALAHSLGNSVEAAYRRGDLFEKRRALMDDWAQYVFKAPKK
jgi:integrase